MISTPVYRFARIKVHPKLDLSGWYLVIEKANIDLMFDMHRSAACSTFMRFHRDPHLYNQKTWQPVSDHAEFFNPVKLSAGWLSSIERAMRDFGVAYMNRNHGLLYGTVQVLETRDLDKLEFPKDEDEQHKDGVTITISRWGCGTHYYLSGNKQQVFSQPKFDTYDEAMVEARKHAFEKNITFKPTEFMYAREGD